ncbi:hypothetical protein ZEAMMB73_Zm00001d025709 [Zea mays]|uniref:Uncharacterized protein n=1 Tax=Zea mays TaxID=4577 RepID=K7U4F6_MAIZE|nr:hypothetical protein ZEAMMB73_Zm00001d025709 [Zea mays]
MVSLGIARLVAFVLLVVLVFGSSLHQQEGAGATRLHERRQQHAQQWAEERNQLRSYMTMDYAPWRRRVPKHN